MRSHHTKLKHGNNSYPTTTSSTNIPISHTRSGMGLMQEFALSQRPSPLRTVLHFTLTRMSTFGSWIESCQPDVTLDHYLSLRWNIYWALSKLPHSLWYQNQEDQEGAVLFITSHIRILQVQLYCQLITLLIRIFSHAHGERSPLSAIWYGISHLAHRHLSVTWLKLIGQSLSPLNNGLAWLSNYVTTISSQSTPTTTSDSPLQVVFMVILVMQLLTSFGQVALDLF
jgi:hypothetical protein